jgi:TP901 family phage tail tape measure protein
MERFKDNILDFFSIGNTIQIFKNALRDAFDTVKELDAAMTETAVVTDFSIGDMWEKLPEYSKTASELGSSIKDLYGATTLYYQQGLNTEQAMSVGIETMKMARIANMEGADATKAMTAALRGFNMEINETSAKRVNDVYSELAAITAADT